MHAHSPKDLIQSPGGRRDRRNEDFHKRVVTCSFFITSVLKLLLKDRIKSSASCDNHLRAMLNAGFKGLHLIDTKG